MLESLIILRLESLLAPPLVLKARKEKKKIPEESLIPEFAAAALCIPE